MASSLVERRLAEQFVDRELEMTRFGEMLETGERPIFTVWGAGGLGKSWLLSRFCQESEKRGLSTVSIRCSATRTPNVTAIVRAIVSKLGNEHFGRLAAEQASVSSLSPQRAPTPLSRHTVSVAEQAHIERSTVGVVAGLFVNNATIMMSGTELPGLEQERAERINAAFFADLNIFASCHRTIIFFDAVERMTDECRHWITDDLLPAVISGCTENVFICFFGQLPLTFDATIESLTITHQLGPLALGNIIDYLEKQGVTPELSQRIAPILLDLTKGVPFELAARFSAYRALLTRP